ncbi:MAG: SRPBCC family protein [Pseudomonadota bacterium]
MKQTSEREPQRWGGLEGSAQWGKLAGTAAVGALAMYLFDPDRGRDRRAQSGQQLRGMGKKTGTVLDQAMRGVKHRLGGVRESMSHLALRGGVDQRSLVEHVRSAVERAVSNPMALSIDAQEGSITLGGLVLASERRGLLSAVRAVSGVREVNDRTETLERPDDSAAIERLGAAPAGAGEPWRPATRNAAMVGGGALGLYGLMRRSPMAMLLGLAGVALMARGMRSGARGRMAQGMAPSLAGARGKAQTVSFEKTIRIEATPEQVYDFWSNYENFPQFMSYVVEVRDLGRQRSHWTVKGPGGTEYQWNAVLTEASRPRQLAWRSEPGAEVENAGSVQFEPSRGGTRATVRMSYRPPVGVLGQTVAKLLGNDPQRELEADLARMKSVIERGIAPRDMAQASAGADKFLH